MENTQKPLILAVEDFKANLINLINTSNVPLFIIVDSIKLLMPTLDGLVREEYDNNLKSFNKTTESNEENSGA